MSLWADLAPSARISACAMPGCGRGVIGRRSRRLLDDGEVVATRVLPALPGRGSIASGSPVPSRPWATNAASGWKPNPRLNVGRAFRFCECAITSLAYRR